MIYDYVMQGLDLCGEAVHNFLLLQTHADGISGRLGTFVDAHKGVLRSVS